MFYSDCVVIGSGVAGMTAAIYLKRANIDFVILEKHAPGGQINMTNNIENYPGFNKIDGVTLAMNIFEQMLELGVNYKYGNVLNIELENDFKIIETETEKIKCKKIIIASGRRPIQLGLDNERQMIGRGVSFCATCDGALYKDKKVAVVGNNNKTYEEAIYLSKICEKVIIINNESDYKINNDLLKEIKQNNKIEVYNDSFIETIIEDEGFLQGIVLNDKKQIDVKGLFILIGTEPVNDFFKMLPIELDNNGNIIVDKNMKTSLKDFYACGDIISKELYQVITAASEGAIAANTVQKELK